MALVCDIKSDNAQPQQEPLKDEAAANEDLEDGEIEDDDDEEETPEPAPEEAPSQPQPQPPPNQTLTAKFVPNENKFPHNNRTTRFDRPERHNRYDERKRSSGHLTEAEKSVLHLHKIERIERIEREKRERYKREQATVVDDFASNIEKAIASVLKKDRKSTDDEKEEDDKRGKKRKKKDKDKKKTKQRRIGSPKPEDYDENEMINMRGGSPDLKSGSKDHTRSPSPHSDYDSYDSSTSSDRSRDDRKEKKKDHGKKGSRSKNRDRTRGDRKFRDRSREQKTELQFKDMQGVCLYYFQGKCNKGTDCPYAHEAPHPMKLELCKFYLMECCAKGDKCLYMHSEFPCKFYHTGLPCYGGDNCKFAHGKPLEDRLKQILFKHIETAPKEILGDFPRLSRDGALAMINQAQKNLEIKYGMEKGDLNNETAGDKNLIPSLFDINIPVPAELLQKDDKPKEKADKPRERNRPSRWQDADPVDTSLALQEQQKQQQLPLTFGLKGFYPERGDQDMRINSNGDIDMRTLPPPLNPLIQNVAQSNIHLPTDSSKVDIEQYIRDAGLAKDGTKQDTDIRSRPPQDTDIRQLSLLDKQVDFAKDIDIRRIPSFDLQMNNTTDNDDNDNAADEPNLEIVMEEDIPEQKTDMHMENEKSDSDKSVTNKVTSELPANLPKKQRELFLRIQAQQKENVPENQKDMPDDDRNNIDWYSDDDDDCRLTIKDDIEEPKSKNDQNSEEPLNPPEIPQIKPVEVMEKLGDLSKIDISAEVTKLLSSISQSGVLKETKPVLKDPRTAAQQQTTTETAVTKPAMVPNDPRRARLGSTETKKTEKLSIYEQGSISIENAAKDVDLRNIERDMDMRPIFGDTDLRPPPGRPDIDLRQLGLPFKAMQNYTPATEIDASINSHAPIPWRVHFVDIPRPDYTGLKLSAHDAQNTGDPRLRKIFRLSTEEKDSPASPKESPKAVTGIRADPRRRKMEEKVANNNQMNYAQQLNMLQTSAFYQSLTSNQKVLLNQELASKSDHSGSNDPTLNGILSNLGLLPGPSAIVSTTNTTANTSALNILANVNNMNPMMGQASNMMVQNPNMIGQPQNPPFVNQPVNPNILSQNPNLVNQMAQSIVQPGLLGAAPGVPNLPPDFQLNFDPRQGGLLGNAPFNYNDNSNFNNYNEEYYDETNNFEPPSGGRGGGRGGRGGFRDRQQQRRGRNFSNNRNNSGRNFRNRNRTNRSRTPP